MRGSALNVGTDDVGDSIEIPAICGHVWGQAGFAAGAVGRVGEFDTSGASGECRADSEEFEDISRGQVRLGVGWRDGIIEPSTAAQRLLDEMVGAVNRKGVQIAKLDTLRSC